MSPVCRLVFSQSLISLDLIEDFLELSCRAKDEDKVSPYKGNSLPTSSLVRFPFGSQVTFASSALAWLVAATCCPNKPASNLVGQGAFASSLRARCVKRHPLICRRPVFSFLPVAIFALTWISEKSCFTLTGLFLRFLFPSLSKVILLLLIFKKKTKKQKKVSSVVTGNLFHRKGRFGTCRTNMVLCVLVHSEVLNTPKHTQTHMDTSAVRSCSQLSVGRCFYFDFKND